MNNLFYFYYALVLRYVHFPSLPWLSVTSKAFRHVVYAGDAAS